MYARWRPRTTGTSPVHANHVSRSLLSPFGVRDPVQMVTDRSSETVSEGRIGVGKSRHFTVPITILKCSDTDVSSTSYS